MPFKVGQIKVAFITILLHDRFHRSIVPSGIQAEFRCQSKIWSSISDSRSIAGRQKTPIHEQNLSKSRSQMKHSRKSTRGGGGGVLHFGMGSWDYHTYT